MTVMSVVRDGSRPPVRPQGDGLARRWVRKPAAGGERYRPAGDGGSGIGPGRRRGFLAGDGARSGSEFNSYEGWWNGE
jgi:hypothetical protein